MRSRRVVAAVLTAVVVVGLSACSSGVDEAQPNLPVVTTIGSTTTDPSPVVVETTVGAPVEPAEVSDPAVPPGLYVSPLGNNSNTGASPDDAFGTIAYAVKQLTPGDTLWVLDGEYRENERTDSAIRVTESGTEDAWIRIAAFPGANPVILADHKNGMKIDGANYVEVRGLSFKGSIDPNLLAIDRYSGSGINVDAIYNDGGPQPNHHVRIIGNTISGFGAGGIPVTGTSHVEIRDNVIFDVASSDPNQHSGISIFEPTEMGIPDDEAGYSNYISGNVVYRVENTVPDPRLGRITDGNCIIMDLTRETGYQGRTLISNNLCVDNGGRGVQTYRSAHVDVVNNTLFSNSRTPAIASQGGDLGAFESLDVTFANNLVFTDGAHAPARASGSTDIRFENNAYVSSAEAQYGGHEFVDDRWINDSAAAGVVVNAGSVPDPASFSLIPGSIAVDAGTDRFESVVDLDHTGVARSIGAMPDIGAFEYSK